MGFEDQRNASRNGADRLDCVGALRVFSDQQRRSGSNMTLLGEGLCSVGDFSASSGMISARLEGERVRTCSVVAVNQEGESVADDSPGIRMMELEESLCLSIL